MEEIFIREDDKNNIKRLATIFYNFLKPEDENEDENEDEYVSKDEFIEARDWLTSYMEEEQLEQLEFHCYRNKSLEELINLMLAFALEYKKNNIKEYKEHLEMLQYLGDIGTKNLDTTKAIARMYVSSVDRTDLVSDTSDKLILSYIIDDVFREYNQQLNKVFYIFNQDFNTIRKNKFRGFMEKTTPEDYINDLLIELSSFKEAVDKGEEINLEYFKYIPYYESYGSNDQDYILEGYYTKDNILELIEYLICHHDDLEKIAKENNISVNSVNDIKKVCMKSSYFNDEEEVDDFLEDVEDILEKFYCSESDEEVVAEQNEERLK